MTINIGIIGAGRIGRIHAENIATQVQGASAFAIADTHLPAAQETAAKLGIPNVSDTHRDMLANPDVHAVAICSITDTHAQYIIEAAQAGKHIFCEKPIDYNLARIDEALAAVEKAGVKLQIGFNRRFDPNFCYAREVITSGQIGEPHLIRITSRDPEPAPMEHLQHSAGLLMETTIHDFDMVRFLMDSPVTEIYAAASVLVAPYYADFGHVDTAMTMLRFESGALGVIDNSYGAVYGYDQRAEVLGPKGAVSTDNQTANRTVLNDANGIHSPNPLYFFPERYANAYAIEMQAFVDAITNDTPVPVTGADGRAPVVMALAALKSIKENRPVKLSEFDL
ncbi:MAG: inositol 2-dehydrogenase [Burkholderiales bacterium]|nr:inositol 2-dehydrogenase [Anaerolineae bacterium]